MKKSYQHSKSAYSLLELSIVIVIISVLITAALTTSISTIASARNKVTKDRLREIYNAIGNYVSANGKLPCPAAITLLKGDSNYGTSVGSSGSCSGTGVYQSASNTNLFYGMVPAVSLGLSKDMAEDGFEDKIAYVVDKNFTSAANLVNFPNFDQTNFSITSAYNIANNNVIITATEKQGGAAQTVESYAFFVLISYGANKNGAFGINSTTRNARSTDINSDELSNDIDNSNNFDNAFITSSGNSDSFDDIILFSSPRSLIADFNLYRFLPCNNNADGNYVNSIASNAWFGQIVYGNACTSGSTSTDPDKKWAKKCGPNGTWIQILNCSNLP